ncbi:hypothetical protein I7I53_09992 [Histoplasma capsulatum var. duboisii H88]|uniref:Uncharacterized protein n=1 Tax=Ajellomyces capsulatus (strain H88) TaxID=544711 RepID=A0A8A1LA87_AJEC8|nr:hypothetical protein I7I53_09992 [Histoplasma capsulatum var. duboisii H88]
MLSPKQLIRNPHNHRPLHPTPRLLLHLPHNHLLPHPREHHPYYQLHSPRVPHHLQTSRINIKYLSSSNSLTGHYSTQVTIPSQTAVPRPDPALEAATGEAAHRESGSRTQGSNSRMSRYFRNPGSSVVARSCTGLGGGAVFRWIFRRWVEGYCFRSFTYNTIILA